MASFAGYRSLMLTRNAEGMLAMEFHTGGGFDQLCIHDLLARCRQHIWRVRGLE